MIADLFDTAPSLQPKSVKFDADRQARLIDGMAASIQASCLCTAAQARAAALTFADTSKPFAYSPWRHGGWYVSGIRYPEGGCGCVSRNYPDNKWRIACLDHEKTFKSRDDAARAEQLHTLKLWAQTLGLDA